MPSGNGTSWEFLTYSAEETIQKGRELASRLKPPVLVLLSGELGAGKTTLAKGIVSGLGAAREEEVTSPTFTLVHVFRSPPWAEPPRRVYHVDLYRVSSLQELETLGLEDALGVPAVVVVEWAERLTLRTNWPRVQVLLEHRGDDVRRIEVRDSSGVLSTHRTDRTDRTE
jgi:tRNA threonylcarbamoyladenosine biosynthesis protein TsaE